VAHVLGGEPVPTPDQVRGRLSPEHALIAKNRQSLVLGLTELAMLSRMKSDNSSRHAGAAQPSAASAVSPCVAIGAMIGLVLPTIATWVYFVLAADDPEGVQRAIGLATKFAQFAFPVIWVRFALKERIQLPPARFSGVSLGLLFAVAITLSGWIIFQQFLRDSSAFAAAIQPIREKVAGFGLDSPEKYVALGVLYSLAHSLLEEYYWRWFVFGQLLRVLPIWLAISVSAVGFAAHHVIILATFFGWASWQTVLFSVAVAGGGAFWAWLYQRTGSLVGCWLSHLVIDAGIFAIGYHLLRTMWT